MIQIILSADIDQDIDIIPDLMEIEKQVYLPAYCGVGGIDRFLEKGYRGA